MEVPNFWNETLHLLTLADSSGFHYKRVGHETGESVRYWLEPGVADVPPEDVEDVVRQWWSDHSHYDYTVDCLPEGPVELEVYNTRL